MINEWLKEEELPSEKKFYSSFSGQKNSDKEYEYLKVWKKFEM